jgi:hypothetical protein
MSPGTGKLINTILCRFFTPNLQPDSGLNDYEKEIIELLAEKNPLSFAEYHHNCLYHGHMFPGLQFLSHPAILISAFTPTDALSVLGLFKEGLPEASLKAAVLLGMLMGKEPEEFARLVLNKFGETMVEEIVKSALSLDKIHYTNQDFGEKGFFSGTISQKSWQGLKVELSLKDPVVLLGAPVGVLLPWAQKFLKARFLAPPRFEVASATGAAASSVALSRKVDIIPLPDLKTYRAFLPDQLLDGYNLNSLVESTKTIMTAHMLELARLAGAGENCPINVTRDDRTILTGDGVYLPMGTTLNFTAGS